MISLDLNTDVAQQLAKQVTGTQGQMKKAFRGALSDTGSAGVTFVKKRVSASTRVAQKRLAVRMKKKILNYDEHPEVELFFGANPVAFHTIGTLTQTRSGVTAGRMHRKGAFTPANGGLGGRAFIRASSKHFKPEFYSTESFFKGSVVSKYGSVKSRFPLRLATVQINDEVGAAVEEFSGHVQEIFDKKFKQRMNYEVNVK
ncbi:hypothetical protein [Desulfotalea psychrophila]|uniref:Uncharacterized protein n=1 Tax=Desulfotalea psychrophila (strain LSv54 / DSM 12343) TaxID=177439 RepID=Q6AMV8_DESPS|nr:hypothetical protein [Desulfotalea psychrophila]CAG36316.1 unknown protein [Desulfotalea psychrophila LSv54]